MHRASGTRPGRTSGVDASAQFSGALVAANWDSMVFDTGGETLKRVPMMEPLRGGKDKVEAILDRADDAAALLEALGG